MKKAEYLAGLASILISQGIGLLLEDIGRAPRGSLTTHPSELDISPEAAQREITDTEHMSDEAVANRLAFGERILAQLEQLEAAEVPADAA